MRWILWVWQRIGDASVVAWLLAAPMTAGAGYWAWVSQWGYLPVALVALGVFVGTIWGVNGVIWMQRQRRPSRARIAFDYSYGLVLEDVAIAFDQENEANTLEVRLKIRNHATGPMRYLLESLQTTIEDRFFATPNQFGGVLARGAGIMLFPGGGFTKEAFDSFADRTTGRVDFSIAYGHPEDALSQRVTKRLVLQLFKRKDDKGQPTVGHLWTIGGETDAAI